ncbi:unnamed protein product [Diamesa hyperborea]
MIVRVAIKSGLCYAAVKYTVDEGVWGPADKTVAFKNKMCKTVNENHYYQTGKAHFPMELPDLPKTSQMCFVTKHYYNQGVKNSIRFVEMIPCYMGQGIKKASDTIKQAMDQTKQPQP